eukprot:353615-Chlamydomonas_euryale.AAC.13
MFGNKYGWLHALRSCMTRFLSAVTVGPAGRSPGSNAPARGPPSTGRWRASSERYNSRCNKIQDSEALSEKLVATHLSR